MPATILRYFTYKHLTVPAARRISEPFALVAEELDRELPDGPEKSVALRKLLESKDAAVRASLPDAG